MRYIIAIVFALVAAVFVSAGERLKVYDVPLSEEPSPYAGLNLSPAQLIAAQELELAQYRFILWTNYEYPSRLRQLDAELALAQAELASLQRRQIEFNRFNVWTGGGNPLFLESEDAGLGILALQQRLALLQAERGHLLQYQGIEYRQRQIDFERARMNLRMAR
jgi:hypothetical protein